jgi:cellulose synthase (UDP-forming)
MRQQSELVRLTFSRADTWAASWGAGQPDTPLAALREVGAIGIGGLFTLGRATLHELRLALRRTPTQPLDTLMDKP